MVQEDHARKRIRGAIGFLYQDQIPTHPDSPAAYFRAAARSMIIVRHMATFMFRLSQYLGVRWAPLGYLIKQLNHILTGADLAWQASVGAGLVLHHPTGVVWGPDVTVGARCRVQQGVTIGGRGGGAADGSPAIGDDVILGAGARVLGPIHVGDRVLVGANAVVVRDARSGATLVGVPARDLRST